MRKIKIEKFEKDDLDIFRVFAKLHPVEAYNLRPDDFCIFMREEGYNLSNDQIKAFISRF